MEDNENIRDLLIARAKLDLMKSTNRDVRLIRAFKVRLRELAIKLHEIQRGNSDK